MKNNTNISGHVRERVGKNGISQQIILNTVDPITGERKRITETYHCTKKQAQEILKKRSQTLSKYGMPQYQKKTVAEFLEYYVEARKADLAATTYEGYKSDIKKRINPYIGGILVGDLNKQQVRKWEQDLVNNGYSNKSIKNAHRLLHTAYEYAVECDMVSSNPCKFKMNLPKQSDELNNNLNIYNEDEINKVIKTAQNTDMYLILMLLLNLGLRRGELAGLRWLDVDLQNRIVHIRNNRVAAAGNIIEKSPKSKSGNRDLPIGDNLTSLLQSAHDSDINKFGSAFVNNGYVVHKDDGTPYSPDSITQKWERFVQKNDLRPIRLHDLRHTAISHLLANGNDIKSVQKIAGHSNAQTTLDIYAKPVDSKVQSAMKALDDLTFNYRIAP